MRRDIGTDDPRVRVRPGRASRPRTKIRPTHRDAVLGRVFGVDRGRYHVLIGKTRLTTVKARELGRRAVVVGDWVRVTGDLSGRKDTLARIVGVEQRTTELRRSTEEGDGRERVIVANAQAMAIVVALAQPEPRIGMIDRCLVAAYNAGMSPYLVLTKRDLAHPYALLDYYTPLGLPYFLTSLNEADDPAGKETCLDEESSTDNDSSQECGLKALAHELRGKDTVLVGHSGVGKSTLINALVPGARRTTGHVNDVTGKGRHTSTSAIAFELPGGGTLIDTPGVRSFGLSHVSAETILEAFPDLHEIGEQCPRGCDHQEGTLECELSEVNDPRLRARVASFRRLVETK